jgi:hypothetical protein
MSYLCNPPIARRHLPNSMTCPQFSSPLYIDFDRPEQPLSPQFSIDKLEELGEEMHKLVGALKGSGLAMPARPIDSIDQTSTVALSDCAPTRPIDSIDQTPTDGVSKAARQPEAEAGIRPRCVKCGGPVVNDVCWSCGAVTTVDIQGEAGNDIPWSSR